MQEFSGYAKGTEEHQEDAENAENCWKREERETNPARSIRLFFLKQKAQMIKKPYLEIRKGERKRIEKEISRQINDLCFNSRV
ncbi:MAG: hypothetical protein ACTFAL_00120 [Candidatus Electronema sp. V4]|uniref:hypothetical protein n=1 Tax=Candidatus Electronema sp. V4 TaxID=3454756 RepID=UPI0040557BB1